jgi:glycosyltransferase involved in cell wall biosynthesis
MKAKQKHLVLLIPGFAADERDSTCLPAQQAFVKSLHHLYPELKITVIAFQYPFTINPYSWNGIRVCPLDGRNKGGARRLITWYRASKLLARLNKSEDLIGVLSFWCGECALIGKRFATKNKLKHYCWILGQDAKKENRFVTRIKPMASELIAMSDFLKTEFHKNHGIIPQLILPNAIDTSLFTDEMNDRTIHLIGVGSLIRLKRYEIFVEVLGKLVLKFPSLRAIICGKGEEQENLQHLINELGLKGHVQLVGEKSHQDVLQLLQQSKILLHPSSYEGYSGACAEALYAGAHVVSFCSPSPTSIKHWHLVETTEEMISKAEELLSDPLLDHNRVLVHPIEESARTIMSLFTQRAVAASSS